jgi:hypothetical protein
MDVDGLVAEVYKLSPKPGDLVVLRCDGPLGPEAAGHVAEQLRRLPLRRGVACVVLDQTMRLQCATGLTADQLASILVG